MEAKQKRLLRRIYDQRGYLEDFHIVLAEKDAEFLENYLKIFESVFKGGVLDKKAKSLVVLGVMAVLRMEPGLHNGINRALKSGATPEEILEAIKIAYIFSGNATLVPALATLNEKLRIASDSKEFVKTRTAGVYRLASSRRGRKGK